MINLPTAFIAFVLGFGFLVFIHELGHFLVAKWVGIRCTQFAIGFGPAIVSWRKGLGMRFGSTEATYYNRAAEKLREQGHDPDDATQEQALAAADELGLSETEYRLNYLPLGGYVKMLGQEDMDAAARSDDPRSFNNKSVGARFAVISAGVIMNLITGVAFFVIAFMAGVEFPPAIVGGVDPSMPAATTYAAGYDNDPNYRGLRVGDRITHIDGDPITDLIAVKLASALGTADQPIELTVDRAGVSLPLTYRITPQVDAAAQNLLSLGILPPMSTTVGAVVTGTHVHDAGVRPGMQLVAVDDNPIDSYPDYHHTLADRRGQPVTVSFEDPETQQRVDVDVAAIPRLPASEDGVSHIAGLIPATLIPEVVADSPASNAGIQGGDVLAELGGEPWPHPDQVLHIVQSAEGRPIHVTVWRDEQLVPIGTVTPGRDDRLGIHLTHVEQPIVAATVPDTAAAALDLPGGTVLRSINDRPVATWGEAMQALATIQVDEQPVAIDIEYELSLADRPVESAQLMLEPAMARQIAQSPWVPPMMVLFETLQEPVAADTPWQATVLGLEKTQQFVMQAYVMILRLTQGTVEVEHLRGPVGILDEGTKITQRGWSYYFYFLGLLSVNLAVINFLPIPIADGGHAVFLLAEKIKGSPVHPNIQVAAMYVGLVLIGGLFLLVTYHDIWRMIN